MIKKVLAEHHCYFFVSLSRYLFPFLKGILWIILFILKTISIEFLFYTLRLKK